MLTLETIRQNFLEKGYSLQPYQPLEHYHQLFALFKTAIEKKDTLPWDDSSEEEFKRRFVHENSHVYVLTGLEKQEVVGGLSFKAKRAGRCAHVAKVLYVRSREHAGKGLSELIVQASLFYAKEKEFHILQSCLIDGRDRTYLDLFKKTGFELGGFLQSGIRGGNGGYSNGFFFQRDLNRL